MRYVLGDGIFHERAAGMFDPALDPVIGVLCTVVARGCEDDFAEALRHVRGVIGVNWELRKRVRDEGFGSERYG